MDRKEKIVITTGTFNLITPGHIHFLKSAKKLGDKLIVFLDSDERNKNLKGDKCIFNYRERENILRSIKFVDDVRSYNDPTTISAYIKYNLYALSQPPDIIFVKGGDYNISSIDPDQLKVLRDYGGIIAFIEYDERYSTTRVFKIIQDLKDSPSIDCNTDKNQLTFEF